MEKPNRKNISISNKNRHLGLKHTLCKYMNDANGAVTLAKVCGQILSVYMTNLNQLRNLCGEIYCPQVNSQSCGFLYKWLHLVCKNLPNIKCDHTLTLLGGFHVIAFPNMSQFITQQNCNSDTIGTIAGNSKRTIIRA